MPKFVELSDRLRPLWIAKWEELIKNSFDLSEVWLKIF